MTSPFDLCGALRRIRRAADMAQRELAAAAGVGASTLAHAEAGTRDLPVGALCRAAAAAGFRLALIDGDGAEVAPMADGTVRDRAGRRFPAHLDTHHSDERSGRDEHRHDRPLPWYTVDRNRRHRDEVRGRAGTPADHLLPQIGDAPAERRRERRAAAWRRREEERQRRLAAGEGEPADLAFDCACPPECAELDDRSGPPVHTPDCRCGCDLC